MGIKMTRFLLWKYTTTAREMVISGRGLGSEVTLQVEDGWLTVGRPSWGHLTKKGSLFEVWSSKWQDFDYENKLPEKLLFLRGIFLFFGALMRALQVRDVSSSVGWPTRGWLTNNWSLFEVWDSKWENFTISPLETEENAFFLVV